ETRVYRHEEQHVELVHHIIDAIEPGGGIEHQPRLAAQVADQLQGAIHMAGGLGVEGDPAGAGIGEHADHVIHRLHHEVNIDGRGHPVVAQRLAYHRADGEV